MSTAFDGKNFLLVDDDPDMITAMEALLGETGATLAIARDGDTAVQKAAEIKPDLVILDAMLPKRSGFLVLEKLKSANTNGQDKPLVIMVTGNEGKRHQTWAESLGVDGYINKPFRMERLMEKIEQLLAK